MKCRCNCRGRPLDDDTVRRWAMNHPKLVHHIVRCHCGGNLKWLCHRAEGECDLCLTQGDASGRSDVPEVPWSDSHGVRLKPSASCARRHRTIAEDEAINAFWDLAGKFAMGKARLASGGPR